MIDYAGYIRATQTTSRTDRDLNHIDHIDHRYAPPNIEIRQSNKHFHALDIASLSF